MLRIKSPTSGSHLRWAIRANRKFTGHEDDGDGDAALYTVKGSTPTHAVVTVKENGMTFHLSARLLTLDNRTLTLVMIGSKKVHFAAEWNKNAENFFAKASQLVSQAERYTVVRAMLNSLQNSPRVVASFDSLVTYLCTNRLVLCAEYVEPVGSGPIDNRKLHGLKDSAVTFGFSLVPNVLKAPKGCELSLDPIYSLVTLQSFGLNTVAYVRIPLTAVNRAKNLVSQLPCLEGAVIYYCGADGVIQLEKSKSIDYIIVRAAREKLKRYLLHKTKGVSVEYDKVKTALESEQAVQDKKTFVVNPSSDTPGDFGKFLEQKLGAQRKDQSLMFSSQPDLEAARKMYLSTILVPRLIGDLHIALYQMNKRINQIDQVPITRLEKRRWMDDMALFFKWVYERVLGGPTTGVALLDRFSIQWSEFERETKRKDHFRTSSEYVNDMSGYGVVTLDASTSSSSSSASSASSSSSSSVSSSSSSSSSLSSSSSSSSSATSFSSSSSPSS